MTKKKRKKLLKQRHKLAEKIQNEKIKGFDKFMEDGFRMMQEDFGISPEELMASVPILPSVFFSNKPLYFDVYEELPNEAQSE